MRWSRSSDRSDGAGGTSGSSGSLPSPGLRRGAGRRAGTAPPARRVTRPDSRCARRDRRTRTPAGSGAVDRIHPEGPVSAHVQEEGLAGAGRRPRRNRRPEGCADAGAGQRSRSPGESAPPRARWPARGGAPGGPPAAGGEAPSRGTRWPCRRARARAPRRTGRSGPRETQDCPRSHRLRHGAPSTAATRTAGGDGPRSERLSPRTPAAGRRCSAPQPAVPAT